MCWFFFDMLFFSGKFRLWCSTCSSPTIFLPTLNQSSRQIYRLAFLVMAQNSNAGFHIFYFLSCCGEALLRSKYGHARIHRNRTNYRRCGHRWGRRLHIHLHYSRPWRLSSKDRHCVHSDNLVFPTRTKADAPGCTTGRATPQTRKRERKDGLPSGGGWCRSDRLVHSVCSLAGSGTSFNVQWQKGRRGRENLSTSSYAHWPVDEENWIIS